MTNPPYYGPPQPAWGPPPSPAPKPSRVPMIVAFVGIFIAIALGVVALLRPAAQAAAPADVVPQYSEQQVAEAKKAVCGAHDLVNRATQTAGRQSSDDPTQKFVIAVNIRVGSIASSSYLLNTLAQYPATAPSLATALRETALVYQEATLLQLALAPKNETDIVYSKLNTADAKVVDECK